jgi:hypothetical protein
MLSPMPRGVPLARLKALNQSIAPGRLWKRRDDFND